MIDFDHFAAVDMRVGRIVEVEDFPEARTPAWKLLYEQQSSYNPDSHTYRVIYGKSEAARYGFETIDPFEPHRPETEYERESHLLISTVAARFSRFI